MTGSSQVEANITHSPLAFIYSFFTPTVTINGEKIKKSWGVHTFELEPGTYELSFSYPWLFSPECGKATVRVSLAPNEKKKIKYRAGLVRYLPGQIKVG